MNLSVVLTSFFTFRHINRNQLHYPVNLVMARSAQNACLIDSFFLAAFCIPNVVNVIRWVFFEANKANGSPSQKALGAK